MEAEGVSMSQQVIDVLAVAESPLTAGEIADIIDPAKRSQIGAAVRGLVDQGRAEITSKVILGGKYCNRYRMVGRCSTDKTPEQIADMILNTYVTGETFTRSTVANDLGLPYDAVCAALNILRVKSRIVKTRRGPDVARYCSTYTVSVRRR